MGEVVGWSLRSRVRLCPVKKNYSNLERKQKESSVSFKCPTKTSLSRPALDFVTLWDGEPGFAFILFYWLKAWTLD